LTTVTPDAKTNILKILAMSRVYRFVPSAFQANYAGSIPATRLLNKKPQTNEKSTVWGFLLPIFWLGGASKRLEIGYKLTTKRPN
jgi:hypothetical protein